MFLCLCVRKKIWQLKTIVKGVWKNWYEYKRTPNPLRLLLLQCAVSSRSSMHSLPVQGHPKFKFLNHHTMLTLQKTKGSQQSWIGMGWSERSRAIKSERLLRHTRGTKSGTHHLAQRQFTNWFTKCVVVRLTFWPWHKAEKGLASLL